MMHFIVMIAFGALMGMTSCKKDYTCTCVKDVAGVSSTTTHDLENQNYNDAYEACERFESDANNGGIGTTNCNL